MSTKLLGAAVAVVSLVLVPTARAQTKATSASRIRLVRAQCTTGPCAPGFDFKRGGVQLRTVKNPKPVGDRRFGKVSITGLDPAPATLEVEVTGTRTFGTDPNSNCALAGSQTSGVFGTSTMTCNLSDFGLSHCRGDLFFESLLPPGCSDVRQTIQDVKIEVYQGGFLGDSTKRIATDGIAILGKSPDCSSGGSGCP